MEDLFSILNIEVEEVKTVTATQKAKDTKKQKEKAAIAKSKSDTEELKEINLETIIRFASLNHGITDYFTNEEIQNGIRVPNQEGKEEMKKITKEDVRCRMERDYPELVKELTNMVFINEKNMIVVMNVAGKKGAITTEKTAPSISKGAVFWNNGMLYFSDSKKPLRIPYDILNKFIAIARGFACVHGVEVHGDVYYSPSSKDFHLHVPPQNTSAVLVEPSFPTIKDGILLSNMVKVLEIHSHHLLSAFPSTTDDNSERQEIYYAIIGQVNQFFPQVYTRTFNTKTQKHIEVSPFFVFEVPVELPDQYPQITIN